MIINTQPYSFYLFLFNNTNHLFAHSYIEVCPRGVMVKALDCGIVVSEFELQLHYYVYFRTNTLGKYMNPLILTAIGLIVPLLFFSKDGFGIK